MYQFTYSINYVTISEHFYLTLGIENYIQPKLYTCSLCFDDKLHRERKGCRGEFKQKVRQFTTDRCPGNYIHNIDYLVELYQRWKRCTSFDDEPAKLIDIFYFIDNRIEEHKEKLRKDQERKAKTRGVSRGNNSRRHN